MGYTTSFEGEFKVSGKMTLGTYNMMRALHGHDGRDPLPANVPTAGLSTPPDAYNQWQIDDDGTAIRWDGGEKFYDYLEWLQWLIDSVLKPAGHEVSGSVRWSGEEVEDCGVLSVEDGQVVATKLEPKGVSECPECGHRWAEGE